MALGINRIAGSGLMIVDFIRSGESLKDTKNIVLNFVGQYAGSFFTTFRAGRDIFDVFDPQEGIFRSTRETPLFGPVMNSIPKISQLLPESKSPILPGIRKTPDIRGVPGGLAKQLTGFTIKQKTPIMRELDSIQFPRKRLFSRTGIPEADNKIAALMAPNVEAIGNRMIQSPGYQTLSKPAKKILWQALLQWQRGEATERLKLLDPKLGLRLIIENKQDEYLDIIQDRTGLDLRDKAVVDQLFQTLQQLNSQGQSPAPSPGPVQ